MKGPDARGGKGRASWLLRLVALVAALAAIWWICFGSLSPCESMRAEAKRVGSAEAGFFGKLAAGALTDLRADDFTPFECAVAAVKLKVHGTKALTAIIARGRDALRAPGDDGDRR